MDNAKYLITILTVSAISLLVTTIIIVSSIASTLTVIMATR